MSEPCPDCGRPKVTFYDAGTAVACNSDCATASNCASFTIARLRRELAAARAVGERDFCRVVYLGNRVSPLDTAERDELSGLLAKAYKLLAARAATAEPKEPT